MSDLENIIFDIAEALRVPVLVLALLALAVVLVELGGFVVELLRRRRRDFTRLETASLEARAALDRGDEPGAKAALRPVAWSTGMARALAFIVDQLGKGQTGDRMAKGLADFDFRSLRRLERTRLLVRAGPALGLMGTLIPLSPALEGLASGNTEELSDNLRVAFSVTVLGLLIGAIAFAISLVRDRLYGQDLSDLEFVAATLAPDIDLGGAAAARPLPAARPAATPPPPPTGAAAVRDKPPPPKDAKPLSADLPPPGGGPAVRGDGTPVAPGAGSDAPARPAGGKPATEAAPPAGSKPAAGPPAAPGGGKPAAGAPAAPFPPPPPLPGGGVAPPPTPAASEPGAASTPTPSAGADAAPAPTPSGGQSADSPSPATLPPPPIPEAPTETLPSSPADRPTQAQNNTPGDGQAAPDPAPENK